MMFFYHQNFFNKQKYNNLLHDLFYDENFTHYIK
jgi:hypothetical protein